jgi:hypothetical protein
MEGKGRGEEVEGREGKREEEELIWGRSRASNSRQSGRNVFPFFWLGLEIHDRIEHGRLVHDLLRGSGYLSALELC